MGRDLEAEQIATSTMDAIVKGTGAGLELLLNIVAMLIVFVALVHLANAILGLLPDVFGDPLTLQRMLGWIMALPSRSSCMRAPTSSRCACSIIMDLQRCGSF